MSVSSPNYASRGDEDDDGWVSGDGMGVSHAADVRKWAWPRSSRLELHTSSSCSRNSAARDSAVLRRPRSSSVSDELDEDQPLPEGCNLYSTPHYLTTSKGGGSREIDPRVRLEIAALIRFCRKGDSGIVPVNGKKQILKEG